MNPLPQPPASPNAPHPTSADRAILPLPARLTVAEAGALRDRVLPFVDADELTLDGSRVESVGIAGLQVLAALIKARGNRPTRWRAPSPTLLDAVRLSGTQSALGQPKKSGDTDTAPTAGKPAA
ncbi:MAG TPA: STAS domain-containing protein [Nevskiaceae bacterium]|nr:STAS domain-containing protein [Nevskiaceae bacterium]